MTGLQVWLHPSSRTKISFQFLVFSSTENGELKIGNWFLKPVVGL